MNNSEQPNLENENNKNNKQATTVRNIILFVFLVLVIWSASEYTKEKENVYSNWILVAATLETREYYKKSDDTYYYKYGIVYEVQGEEHHSYIISSYGSVFELGMKIDVFINPNNLDEAKIYHWKTYQ